jgi:hypothetical protein
VNGPWHFREAERLLGQAYSFAYGDNSGTVEGHTAGVALAAMAQAHATLANTAAIVEYAGDTAPAEGADERWSAVLDPPQVDASGEYDVEDDEDEGPSCTCPEPKPSPFVEPELHARTCPVFALSELPVGSDG